MKDQMNRVLEGLRINAECVNAEAHRHLAFFDIKLSSNHSVLSKLERNLKEIALHLKTKTIPIIKLEPEKGLVKLQVALTDANTISLTELYSGEDIPIGKMTFPILLGEDDSGKKLWTDMVHNPHLLISGTTGSGKSTVLHSILANALYLKALNARDVAIYLTDPKQVEFVEYKECENLNNIIQSVAITYKETIEQLKIIYINMEKRYEVMHNNRVKSIEEHPRMFPLILCIIDEVSDLIMQDKKKELQNLLVAIAQKGRAAGIFLVLSTQRPSVDVITGLLKANFPGRIACKTASRKDSEVILDRPGAETLLGRGDAIMQNMKVNSVRFQVSYTTPEENIRVFNFLSNYASTHDSNHQ